MTATRTERAGARLQRYGLAFSTKDGDCSLTNLAPKKEGPALYAELQDEAWTAVEDIALRAEDAGADGRFVSRLGLLMACLRHLSEEQEILRQGDGRPPSPQTVGANSGLPPPF